MCGMPDSHSAETLPAVVEDIRRTVEADGRYDFEVILANDNPPDETWQVIQQLAAADRRVKGLCMIRNFGQHAALMAGYRASRGDIIISLDDDGQTPPDQVFKLVDALDGTVDAVYGDYPADHKFANPFRRFGSNVNDKMAEWLLKKPKGLYLASYYAVPRYVMDEVIRYQGPYPYVDGLVLRSAGRFRNVPIAHKDRAVGQSGYSLKKLLGLWLNGFTSFSVVPLRLATLAGALFACAGFVFALVPILRKLVLGAAIDPGWTSIVCLMLIIGGMLMVMVGLAGEYIGRIYVSMNAAPQYALRQTCNLEEDNAAPKQTPTP